MDAGVTTDVYRTVEFGRERYWMNRIPLALLGCTAGLFMIAMDPGPPGFAPLVILGVLLVVGAALAIPALAMDHAIDRLKSAWTVGFVLALVLALGVLVFFGVSPRHHRTPMPISSFGTMGWMFVFFSLGYVGFALAKHVRPERPLMTLSPEGLRLHISWLKDLLIPWHEIERVGQLEHILPGGTVSRHPGAAVVAMSHEFYERHILPKRSFLSGRFWSGMFQPKGAQMQMLLPYVWFSIPLKDMQEPVETRWKAFRERPANAPPPASTAPPLRASAWSPKSLAGWQQISFAVPMALLLLMLAHFGGVWDSAFLQTARLDAAKERQRLEQSRRKRSGSGTFSSARTRRRRNGGGSRRKPSAR